MRCASILTLVLSAQGLTAQDPPHLASERGAFAEWLTTSPVSPLAAVYHQPLAGALTFGPEAPPPLDRMPAATLREGRFSLTLDTPDGGRSVPRHRPVVLGDWRLQVSGARGLSVVTVFGPPGRTEAEPAGWYPYVAELVVEGILERPAAAETKRMLALDGVTVDASLAGRFAGVVAGHDVRLVVYRMPVPGTEESELNIFFRDETNGSGTYPAGRFLALRPLGGDRYLADFNRARNPFCAYNSIYPCPVPWADNAVAAPLEAGERYAGGGLEVSP